MPDTQLAAGRVGPAKTHHSDGKGKKDIKNNTNNNGNTASSEICTVFSFYIFILKVNCLGAVLRGCHTPSQLKSLWTLAAWFCMEALCTHRMTLKQ